MFRISYSASRNIAYLDKYLFFLYVSQLAVAFSDTAAVSLFRGGVVVLYTIWVLLYTNPIKDLKVSKINLSIFLFAAFSLSLIVIASSPYSSLYNYARIVPSILIFPVTYKLIKTEHQLNTLFKAVLNIFIFNSFYILAAYFTNNFGMGADLRYGEELVSGRISLNFLTFLIVLAPGLFLYLNRRGYLVNRYLFIFCLIVSLFIIVVSLKRSSLIISVSALLFYAFFTKGWYFVSFWKKLAAIILLLFLLSPLYLQDLEQRFATRTATYGVEMLEEGRFTELEAVVSETFSFHDIQYSFFGRNVFDTTGSYGQYGGYNFNPRRPIHNDFARLLNSTGIFGTAIYFLILWILARRGIALWYSKNTDHMVKIIYAVVFLTSIMIMINGSFGNIQARTLIFSVLGALYSRIGTLKN